MYKLLLKLCDLGTLKYLIRVRLVQYYLTLLRLSLFVVVDCVENDWETNYVINVCVHD